MNISARLSALERRVKLLERINETRSKLSTRGRYRARDPQRFAKCRAFIEEQLKHGPVPANELVHRCSLHGWLRTEFYVAKDLIPGVRRKKKGIKWWYWLDDVPDPTP